MAPIKLLLLYQDRNLPSSRVRVLNLLPKLIQHDFDATAAEYPLKLRDKLRLLKELSGYDLVFLQKKMPCRPEAYLLRTFSAKLIFDFDDAIYMKDDNAPDSFSKTRLNRFRNIVEKADLVVAGNPILAEFTVRFNPRVEVLPSAVPVAQVFVKERVPQNGSLVIGWVGGGKNLHHLAMIAAPLQRLSREIDLELRVVSDREFHVDGVAVRNIAWSLERQETEIAQFDIGIMPLPKNDWNAGKCSYKLLQYMAAAVPVVATDWGFNRYVIKNGETGYLAKDLDDFYRCMKLLSTDPESAREMGRRGRLLVEKDYSIAAVGERLAAIIRQLSA
jgi:glycosyltransferase involved in cell wall biosynthesis